MHELHKTLISVDDCFLPSNVMLPLSACLDNEVYLFVIVGVSTNIMK
jgi:hypothetical protein